MPPPFRVAINSDLHWAVGLQEDNVSWIQTWYHSDHNGAHIIWVDLVLLAHPIVVTQEDWTWLWLQKPSHHRDLICVHSPQQRSPVSPPLSGPSHLRMPSSHHRKIVPLQWLYLQRNDKDCDSCENFCESEMVHNCLLIPFKILHYF